MIQLLFNLMSGIMATCEWAPHLSMLTSLHLLVALNNITAVFNALLLMRSVWGKHGL